RRAQRIAQHVILALQPDTIETARHGIEDLVGTERLKHKVDRAGAQCLYRGIEIGVSRDQYSISEEADGALFRKPVDAILAGHDVVENDDVETALVQLARGRVGVGGLFNVLAAWAQRAHQEVAHAWLVVDDQDRGLRKRAELLAAGRLAD